MNKLILLLVSLMTSSCVISNMKVEENHLLNKQIGTKIKTSTPGNFEFISKDWRIVNFKQGAKGSWKAKTRDDYTITHKFDLDDNGYNDITIEKDRFDLLLQNKKYDSHISLLSIPLSTEEKAIDLRVFARRIQENLAYTTFRSLNLRPDTKLVRSYATKRLNLQSRTFQGQPAVEMVLEIANVNQLKLDPKHRLEQIRFLIVKSPNDWRIKAEKKRPQTNLPVILVAAHQVNPEFVEETKKDFSDFINLISL